MAIQPKRPAASAKQTAGTQLAALMEGMREKVVAAMKRDEAEKCTKRPLKERKKK